MTKWQSDAMLWAENTEDATKLKEASGSITRALDMIDEGLNWLADAADKLSDTPMADKILSILHQMEDLANEMEETNAHYERGERE